MPLVDMPLEKLKEYSGTNPRPADFDAYCRAQRDIDAIWRDAPRWLTMAVRNTSRMGWFSSDRTIRQYAEDVWKVGVA